MTEPKEQAVQVVGVEEAVERLSRLANDASQVEFDENGYLNAEDTDAIRTILQALQGSSLRDTHRATEQPVVGPWWTQYRRSQIGELRPYVPGEPMELLARVSISQADLDAGSPKEGDMIARNPANHDDQWLVAADYFAANFEPLEQNQNRKLGGYEAEGGVNKDLQAQLKAAYEALENSASTLSMLKRNVENEIRRHDGLFRWEGVPEAIQRQIDEDRQALARRGEGA